MKRGINIGNALEAPIEGEWGVTIKEDRNIIATFHYYTPFWFTHQGAGWVNPSPPVGKKWEGFNEQKQFIEDELDKAVNWEKKRGRQLFMGEFGAYSKKNCLAFLSLWLCRLLSC
nr:MAG: hypothetical protein DIU64_06370 [Caldicoprobacter oshimai]